MTEYIFEGFDTPKENWTKTPNGIIEAMSHMGGAEFKCVMYVVRHTWGFHQDERRITLDEFVNGRRKKDRSRMDEGTGLSRPTVIKALRAAEKHGFLVSETDNYDAARIRKTYGLRFKGLNNLTSEVKKSNRRGKESIPRSEKETKKETKKEATEKTSVAPPPKNPEQEITESDTERIASNFQAAMATGGAWIQEQQAVLSGEEKEPPQQNHSEQTTESMPTGKSVPTIAQILGQPEWKDEPKEYGDPIAFGMGIARAREGKTDLAHESVIKAHCLISGLDFEQQPPGTLKKWDNWVGSTRAKITRKPYITDTQFIARFQMLAKAPNAQWLFKVGGPLAGGPYYPAAKMAGQLAAVGRQPEKGQENANGEKQESGRELHEATRSLTRAEQFARAVWRVNHDFDARTGEKLPGLQFTAAS